MKMNVEVDAFRVEDRLDLARRIAAQRPRLLSPPDV
jgi:hypothetical protein